MCKKLTGMFLQVASILPSLLNFITFWTFAAGLRCECPCKTRGFRKFPIQYKIYNTFLGVGLLSGPLSFHTSLKLVIIHNYSVINKFQHNIKCMTSTVNALTAQASKKSSMEFRYISFVHDDGSIYSERAYIASQEWIRYGITHLWKVYALNFQTYIMFRLFILDTPFKLCSLPFHEVNLSLEHGWLMYQSIPRVTIPSPPLPATPGHLT